MWENIIATYSNANGFQIVPDPMSNPLMYYIKWNVVYGDYGSGWSKVITNDVYTSGYHCPFDIDDQWLYEDKGHW